ncbi:mitofusin [Saitoella coloradoensis]
MSAMDIANLITSDLASDSGYGGSVAGGNSSPGHASPDFVGVDDLAEDQVSRLQLQHQQALLYADNRSSLLRSLGQMKSLLKSLKEWNEMTPVYYPAPKHSSTAAEEAPARPSVAHTQSTYGTDDSEIHTAPRPSLTRRSQTTIPANRTDEIASHPLLSDTFQILKLDLKLGHAKNSDDLSESLDAKALSQLLSSLLHKSTHHISNLAARIEDTASKVLVTGDLNAGKSTLVNALLRRHVLPEDQQPCTNTFCEVLDARENAGVEEVHGVLFGGTTYDRHDERTYAVHALKELEDLAMDETPKYAQLKVYVDDGRTIDKSLLRNGVVDIALIDAPGLNIDSISTHALFARQEEIDVVVFVVSAENHFTLSAKEFIWNAAHEKAYIFIVVNRFDNIRDKARCKRMILDQLSSLSPRTRADADELVHFVSAGSVNTGEGGEKLRDFEHLERSLRQFVLEKRAKSKLAPAKTYLLNLSHDVGMLAEANIKKNQNELSKAKKELDAIRPAYEKIRKVKKEVAEEIEHNQEEVLNSVALYTKKALSSALTTLDSVTADYEGLWSIFSYWYRTRDEMCACLQREEGLCEDFARDQCAAGIEFIVQLGNTHLGTEYGAAAKRTIFRPEAMFMPKKKPHPTVKERVVQGSVGFEWSDFVDWEVQEKYTTASLGLSSVAVVVGKYVGLKTLTDAAWKASSFASLRDVRRMAPWVVVFAIGSTAFFIVKDVQRAVPYNLARKMRRSLAEGEYVYATSDRIVKESRKVLSMPEEELRGMFAKAVEKSAGEKEKWESVLKGAEDGYKFFQGLGGQVGRVKKMVESYDLEGKGLKI